MVFIYNNCYNNIIVDKMQKEERCVMKKGIRSLFVMEGSSIERVSEDNGVLKMRLSGACAGYLMRQLTGGAR
jgi:Fe-S cluster biogenesis protein NfuA